MVVTGAFARGMLNFATQPPEAVWAGKTVIYHAMPHGYRMGCASPVRPEFCTWTSARYWRAKAFPAGQHALAERWLDASQGRDSYFGGNGRGESHRRPAIRTL